VFSCRAVLRVRSLELKGRLALGRADDASPSKSSERKEQRRPYQHLLQLPDLRGWSSIWTCSKHVGLRSETGDMAWHFARHGRY
jgi:hypothetical protein